MTDEPQDLSSDDLVALCVPPGVLAEVDRLAPQVLAMALPASTGGGLTIAYWDGYQVVLDIDQLGSRLVYGLAHELGHVDHGLQPGWDTAAKEEHADRYAHDLLCRPRAAT